GIPTAAAPDRPLLEQLGPRQAQDENGRVPTELGDVLDEVEQRRRGPMQVVEHADDRTILRLLFDQLAKAPGDLLCGGRQLGLSEQRPERRGSIAFWQRPELLHDLDHGPIRYHFSVR